MQQAFHQHTVLIVGSTQRRLHVFHMLLSFLNAKEMTVVAYSASMTHEMKKKLERLHFDLKFDVYKQGSLPQKVDESTITLKEMTYEQFLSEDTGMLREALLILADLRIDDTLLGQDIKDKIEKMNDTKQIKEVIYNADTVSKREEGLSKHYIDIDSMPGENIIGFGRSPLSSIHFETKEDSITILTKNLSQEITIPNLKEFSYLKQEGLFGAIAALVQYDFFDADIMTKSETYPFLERDSGKIEVLVWTFGSIHPDEFDALLKIPTYTNVAMGLTNYLRFEDVIERNIERFEAVLVVAEDEAQAELLGDYFLSKEHDSYHSIIFVPNSAEMRTSLQRVFRGQEKKIIYLFDNIGTFIHIHE